MDILEKMEEHLQTIERVKKYFARDNIYKILSSMLGYILPANHNVSFRLNIGGGSYTDGSNLVVGLPEMYMEHSFDEILIILTALLGHEAQHIKSSNFTEFVKYQDEMNDYFKSKYNLNAQVLGKTVHSIANAIEDGRIEKILCNRYPGYLKKIQFLNMTTWKEIELSGENELGDFLMTIATISVTGLYPKNYNDVYKASELDSNINKAKPYIYTGIDNRTAIECLNTCKQLLYVCEDYLVKLIGEAEESQMQDFGNSPNFENSEETETNDNTSNSTHIVKRESQDNQDNQDGENGSDTSEGTDDGKGEEDNKGEGSNEGNEDEENDDLDGTGGSGENSDEANSDKEDEAGENGSSGSSSDDDKNSDDKADSSSDDKSKNDEKSNDKSKEDAKSDNNSSQDAKSDNKNSQDAKSKDHNNQNLVDDLLDEISMELIKEAKTSIDNAEKMRQRNKKEEDKKGESLAPYELDKIREEYVVSKGLMYDEQYNPRLNMRLPANLRSEGKQLRKKIEKLFKDKEAMDMRNLSKGTLNQNDLYKVGVKDYNVFSKRAVNDKSDYVAYFLQDGSGSMHDNNKRYYSAKALSVIEEGFKGIIPFKITTFSAYRNTTFHNVVKKFDDNDMRYSYSYSFYENVMTSGGNKDGYSIRIATAELMKRPEKDKILFVLSDGLPSMYEEGQEALNDVKSAVKDARKKGVLVVALMFGTEAYRNKNYELYKYMYQENIISCNPEDISRQLAKTLLKIVK